ncbi:ATP-binding protein [uncultured Polaribacter sp.]|uniref:sensor histidine kinase n=1 Tax=uncultured Polaribacter sp. TaxID=174711 RepID=UPI00260A18B6|nr:ATP-binding protein [uncultured Polaribacter sp.]
MKVKTWIVLIINSLVLFAVLAVSFIFYTEFSRALDQRILLQLNSIRTLKQNQLTKLIEKEFTSFKENISPDTTASFPIPANKFLTTGIFDLTYLNPKKETAVTFIKIVNGQRFIKTLDYTKIKNILTERAGMGASGESYIVGEDYRLRTPSRFYPEKTPYTIIAKTEGVATSMLNKSGTKVIKDYRNIPVYSAFTPIHIRNLNWVILSEIDVKEITIPLQKLRLKLCILTLFILSISVTLSLFLTKIITNPLKKLERHIDFMAKGNYTQRIKLKKSPKEIKQMNFALDNLSAAIASAVTFSSEIGNMNLKSAYKPKSKADILGESLLKMRNKLEAYRTLESELNTANKRFLIQNLEAERTRLARELHDGLGPLLTTLKIYIQNKITDKDKKDIIKTYIDDAIAEVRQMTNILMPTSLSKFGIGTTLEKYVANIKKSTPILICFDDATKEENSKISVEQAINLYRITQELINNSIKHGNPSQIKISLTEFDDFLSLYYTDNGTGFNTNETSKGFGLNNIKSRVEICKGILKLQSKKGETVFDIEMPINKN